MNSSSGTAEVREGPSAIVSLTDMQTETLPQKILDGTIALDDQQNLSEVILLVEDKAFVRNVVAEVLNSAGYQVLTAASGVKALEVCSRCSGPVGLLLSDVIMPGMNGRELGERFKLLHPDGQVLLMTGDSEQLAQLDSACQSEVIAKPFSAAALLSRVKEALHSNRLMLAGALPNLH